MWRFSQGDVALFWSLTPHSTGPNETDSVRKAYILQVCAALLRKQKQKQSARFYSVCCNAIGFVRNDPLPRQARDNQTSKET